ncbi:MAG: hypothetical protein WAV76_10540 [Bacteroidota bacterium]
MYERSLNEAEIFIRAQKDPVLPVRKVWEDVARLAKAEQFEIASLPDFTALLDADKRFQIIPAHNENEISEVDLAEGDLEGEEMEHLGFFPEDRVRLRAIPVVPEVEAALPEEEEDVASIRHRSFISQAEKKKIEVKKKGTKVLRKKIANKKKSIKKRKSLPKKKTNVRKTKKRKK